jgi:hypothetical protein
MPLLATVIAAGAYGLVRVRRRLHVQAQLEMDRKHTQEAKRTRERWEQAVAKLRESGRQDPGDGTGDGRSP